MINKKTIRCAIYTRTSSDENLEQYFNSLDNQYDFCKNYVEARKFLGLTIIPTLYQDGGYSGGNINRPAFQRLLADVKAGLIDRIIVYKIDRLTRSTIDFAHIYNILSSYDVGFVSVTEDMFDTTTPTGMLIINVFISFAQYEREVAGQRVRDKVANSKARGIFMGGIPPLGYNIGDRELLVNENEARKINLIYDTFIKNHSINGTADYLNERNLKTKEYICRSGKKISGKAFSNQAVLRILKNPLYCGKVSHKDNVYDGQQEAIIDDERWRTVQCIFNEHKISRQQKQKRVTLPKQINRTTDNSLLQGVVFCGQCDRAMSPTYTKKNNVQYRYYVCSHHVKKISKCLIKRIPAQQLDQVVIDEVKKLLKTKEFFLKYLTIKGDYDFTELHELLHNIEIIWDRLFDVEKHRIIRELIKSVTVSHNKVEIVFFKHGLTKIFTELLSNNGSMEITYKKEPDLLVSVPIKAVKDRFKTNEKAKGIALLQKKIAEAYTWKDEHLEFENCNFNGKQKINRDNIRKTFRLNLLAPDIVEKILDGNIPENLNYSTIVNNPIPLLWDEQRKLYGF